MTITNKLARCFVAVGALSLVACSANQASSTSSSASPTQTAKVLQIGIAQIVSHPSLDAIRQGFKDGMAESGYVEGRNVRYDEQNPQGDQAALTSIANNFAAANKDLVVAIATPTAQAMAQVITAKPIVFAGVTDPVAAKLVTSIEQPGGNLTGTSDYPPVAQQMELLKQLKPSAKVVGIVYSSSEVNAQVQTKLATQAAEQLGLSVKTATASNSSEVQQAAQSLSGVDAFYVGNDNTVVSALEALVQVAEKSKAVVIAADPDSVKRGASASYAVDQYKMGKNTAAQAIKVLTGTKPADIPVQRQSDLRLTVNPKTAERAGSPLSGEILGRANEVVD